MTARAFGFVTLTALVACSGTQTPTVEPSRPPAAAQRSYPIPGGGGTTTPEPGGGATTTPDPGPTTTREPGNGIAPALRRDRSDRPPAPGLYRYTTTHTTTVGGEPATFRSSVDYTRARATRVDGGWVQKETVRAAGSTNSETLTYRWSPGRVLQVARAQHAAGRTITCRYDDPMRVLDLPLRADAVWREREPGCAGADDEAGDRITYRVLRTETIVVDRTRVRCFVIDRVDRPATGSGPGTRIRSWFAPAYGLTVHQVLSGAGEDRTTYHLTNLVPYAQEA